MLDTRLNRRPMTRRGVLATACAVVLVALPIAAAQSGPATLTGTILDPSGAPVPDVSLVLSNGRTLAKHQARSDDAGRFDFGELLPGDYLLEARAPAFPPVARSIALGAGQQMRSDLTLDLPGVSVMTVIMPPPENPQPRVPFPPDWSCLPDNPVLCGPSSLVQEFARDEEELLNRRDRLVPARWMQMVVNLPYPEGPSKAGITGTVVIEGRVGTDGFPAALQVVAAVHPDLAEAALQAVREWRFTPARLNGVLVEVPLKASIEFKARD